MKDDELDRLIQDELDGVATPEEVSRLKQGLAEGEANRAKYREMQTVFGLLDRLEMVEPPPDLKPNVLRAIEPRAQSAKSGSGMLARVKSTFQRRPRFRFAYPFALGAAVGALALALATGRFGPIGRDRDSDLSGSMLPRTSLTAGDVLDRAHLELDTAQMTTVTRAHQDGVAVQIGIQSAGEVDFGVRFDPARFAPVGFRQPESAPGHVDLREGAFWIHQRGSGRYELILKSLKDSGPPLQVVLRSGDRSVEGVLRTARAQ